MSLSFPAGRSPRRRPASQSILLLVLTLTAFTALSGCGAMRVRKPLATENIEDATVMGMSRIRGWGDVFSPVLQEDLTKASQDYRKHLADQGLPMPSDVHILALSGGGPDGAFGAGVLRGWTEAGNRPEFRVVTGVSTGALSAPFAFLGPKYDETLKSLYTSVATKDIFFIKGILRMLKGDSITDTGPLHKLLETHVNDAVLQDLAVEHARGRRLYIATTNLDAQRNVVWDITAMAASGHANAGDLIRKVLLASASIPVMFPPVYIPVESGGKTYDEMHVDGGVISQFIVYDAYLRPRLTAQTPDTQAAYDKVRKHIHVIINNKIGPVSEPVKPRLGPIAGRSISTLIKSQAKGALAYSYLLSQRDGMEMGYLAIPDDFESLSSEPFDPVAMAKTFEMGRALGKAGASWKQWPPGYEE